MRRMIMAVGVALAVALAGCGGDGGPAAVPAATGVPRVVATTAVPSPAPSPAPGGPFRFGEVVRAGDGQATATVLAYKRLRGTGLGEPLGSVDIKVCNASGATFAVSVRPWALLFADDTVSDAGQAWSGVTSPEYPHDAARELRPGKCVRGWATFTLSGGKRPAFVEYHPDGSEPMTWVVPDA